MSLKTKVVVHCESHTEMLISYFNATTKLMCIVKIKQHIC